MTEVTKGELAKHIGKSGSIVSRLFKAGVLNSCISADGKKLILEKAVVAIIKNKGRDYIATDIDIPDEIEESKDLFTAENMEELQQLLDQEPSPSKKIDMMDKFWSYKIRHQKFQEAEGELISLNDAKAAIETLLTPLNQYMNSQANDLKNNFPDVSMDVVNFIKEQNNRQKEQLEGREWN